MCSVFAACSANAGFNHRVDTLGAWAFYGSGDATIDLALDGSGHVLSCSEYGVVLWNTATKSYKQSLPPNRSDRRDCRRVFRISSSWAVLTSSRLWRLDDTLHWIEAKSIDEELLDADSDGESIVLALRSGASWSLRWFDETGSDVETPPPSSLASKLPIGIRIQGRDTVLSWTPSEGWLWHSRSSEPIRIASSSDLPANDQISDILRTDDGDFWMLASNKAYRKTRGTASWTRTHLANGSEAVIAQRLVPGASGQLFASGRGVSNTGYLWNDTAWQPTNYLHAIRASDSVNKSWTANGSRIVSNVWTPGGGLFSGTVTNYSLFEEGAPQAILNSGFLVGTPVGNRMIVGVNEDLSVAGSFHFLHGDSISGSLHASELPKHLTSFGNGFAGAIAEGVLLVDSGLTSATVTKLGMDGLPNTRLDRCERHPVSGLVCHQFASGGIGLWDGETWKPMRSGGTKTILATRSGQLHFRDSSDRWHRCENGDCSRATPLAPVSFPGFEDSAGAFPLPSELDRTALRSVLEGRSCHVALWGNDAQARIIVHSKATGGFSEIDIGIPASMVNDIALDSSDRIWFFTGKGAISWKPTDPLVLGNSVLRPAKSPSFGARLHFHDGRSWILCDDACSTSREARIHSADGRVIWRGMASEGSTPLPFRIPFPLFLRLAPP